MRYLIAVVMLAGCQAGPVGPAGERGPAGEPGAAADVAPLLAEIAALRAEVDALRARPVVKVPHLIMKETGEDLGIVTGPGCYYSETMRGEACPWAQSPIRPFYERPDCTGPAYVSSIAGGSTSSQLLPANGTLYRIGGPAEMSA